MRILLTGHKGFIGSRLKHELKRAKITGHGLTAISPEVVGFDCEIIPKWQEKWNDFMLGRNGRFDMIIHCGAISNSTLTGNQLWYFNYETTLQIAKHAMDNSAKLLFVSSAAAIEPHTAYGRTKRCTEDVLLSMLPSSLLTIVRPFNVWGFEETEKSNPSIIYKILNQELKEVYLNCTRDFVHVDDVVDAIIGLVRNWRPHAIYEIGTGEPTVIAELVDTLYFQLETPKKPEYVWECPIQEKLVANPDNFPQKWHPKPLDEFMPELLKRMREKLIPEIDYDGEDH